MFKDKKAGTNRSTTKFQSIISDSDLNGATVLNAGSRFQGTMICQGIARILGNFIGEIYSDGLVVVEEGAVIEGRIHAEHLVLMGRIKGSAEAVHKIEIRSTGCFDGDLSAPALAVEEGAIFNGRSSMQQKQKVEISQTSELEGLADKQIHFVREDGVLTGGKIPEVGIND